MTSVVQECYGEDVESFINYDDTFESCSSNKTSTDSQQTDSHGRRSIGSEAEFYPPTDGRCHSLSTNRYEKNEEVLREKWIRILKNKASVSVTSQNRSDSHLPRGSGKLLSKDCTAVRRYCQEKIRRVGVQQHLGVPEDLLGKGEQRAPRLEPAGELAFPLVPQHFISVLKLKSCIKAMKQAAETDVHHASRCTACQDKRAELARHNFVRGKRHQLERQQLQDKLEFHLCNKDSACLVGELLRDLPMTSDDPGEVWQALMAKAQWPTR